MTDQAAAPAAQAVEQEQQEQVATPTEQQAEVSLSAGYHKVKGTTPEPTADEPKKDEPAAATLDKKEPAQQDKKDEPKVEETKVFGLTEKEFKAAIGKKGVTKEDPVIREVYGKIGELIRTIKDTQSVAASRSVRNIKAEALKRVNEELPGLGAALAQDLTEIFAGVEQAQAVAEAKGQTFDPDKYYQEKVAPALEEIQARSTKELEEAQYDLLTFMHSDYEQVIKSDGFKKFLDTLPADRRKTVVESPRAIVAAQAITDFKAWDKEQTAKAEAQSKQKQKRLESAIPAKGTGSAPVQQQDDENAGFSRGYKRVKGVK